MMKISCDRFQLPPPMPFYLKIPFLKPYWDGKEFLQILYAMLGRGVSPLRVADMAKERFGAKYAIATDRARTACALGMSALDLKAGDEVICPSFFCRTLTQGILQLGCVPVYADIDMDFNINPESIKRCISARTKAIIMAHMFGKLAKIDDILKIAKEHGLYVLDDAAVAAGAMHVGRHAGTFGDFGVISFNIGKQMNATGGGILLTNNDKVYGIIKNKSLRKRSVKKQISQVSYDIFYYYFKRLSAPVIAVKRMFKTRSIPQMYGLIDRIPEELMGRTDLSEEFTLPQRSGLFDQLIPSEMSITESSIAGEQLKKLDMINSSTIANSVLLSLCLKDAKEIALPQGSYPENVFTYYTIILKEGDRYDLSKYLAGKGIETQWTFYPLHLQEKFGIYRHDDMGNTEYLWKRVLSLPVGPYLSQKQIEYIGKCVKGYFSGRKVSYEYKEEIRQHHRGLTETKGEGIYFNTKLDILQKHGDSDSTVLELGCGNGNFAVKLAPYVKHIYGIDFTAEMLASFKKIIMMEGINNVTLANADMAELPFSKDTFDLVFSYSAIYYVRDQNKAISQSYRVLKDNGAAIFEFANLYSLDGLHFKMRFKFFQNFTNLFKAKKLLRRCGFNILKIRYFQFVPNFLKKGIIRRILEHDMGNKTLEECISSLPVLRIFAFRFIFICNKT